MGLAIDKDTSVRLDIPVTPRACAEDDLGRVAYDAYGNARKWKTVSGATMPDWVDCAAEIQAGWIAAALAVVNCVYRADTVIIEKDKDDARKEA